MTLRTDQKDKLFDIISEAIHICNDEDEVFLLEDVIEDVIEETISKIETLFNMRKKLGGTVCPVCYHFEERK